MSSWPLIIGHARCEEDSAARRTSYIWPIPVVVMLPLAATLLDHLGCTVAVPDALLPGAARWRLGRGRGRGYGQDVAYRHRIQAGALRDALDRQSGLPGGVDRRRQIAAGRTQSLLRYGHARSSVLQSCVIRWGFRSGRRRHGVMLPECGGRLRTGPGPAARYRCASVRPGPGAGVKSARCSRRPGRDSGERVKEPHVRLFLRPAGRSVGEPAGRAGHPRGGGVERDP